MRKLLLFVCSLWFAAAAAYATQINIPVTLRPGVTTSVAVQVIENPQATPAGVSVLMVPGLAQTSATFAPLAHALFSDDMGNKVGRVFIADMPGHGASGIPSGMLFGDLALEDYATATIAIINVLSPDVVLGHSMGGVILQMAQDRLLSQGSSLRSAGVRGAVLIAPVIPTPLPWALADSGTAAAILTPFIRFDATYGLIGDVPPPYWVALFYTGRNGYFPAGAPSAADVVARGYDSYESFVAGIQVVRAAFPPFVHARAFAPETGTAASVIALGNDAFFAVDEQRALYDYLTGDTQQEKLFFTISGDDAVHSMHTFAPEALLHSIKKLLNATDRQ